ncbi:calcium/sodium antiporter [Candidatus Woesearchaeota archaeon]|nr:calcium/sodium antiporter [Candidatus Woesearchaeota archaeon]
MHALVYLILGLIGLVIGAELTTRGAISIAKKLKLSYTFIGLTILAIGTDLPELFIDITAAIQKLQGVDTSGLIMGETVGTVISQTTLILGLIGLFGIVIISKREFLRDSMVMIGAAAVMFLMGMDGQLSRMDGLILVIIYVFYLMTVLREEKITAKIKNHKQTLGTIIWAITSLIGGLIFLVFAAKIVVENAVSLANLWGVSQTIVGLLIVGLGTSLPELSICVSAVRKKAGKLSIGNLIGSNIFDILFTLGLSTVIAKGFNVNATLIEFDIPFMIGVAVIAVFLLRTKMKLEKREAVTLISIYIAYVLLKLGMANLI